MQEFERDQPLVVIHADHRVIATPGGKPEQGVGTVRAARVNALSPRRLRGGKDALSLFIAEQTTLPGVRIEGKDREAYKDVIPDLYTMMDGLIGEVQEKIGDDPDTDVRDFVTLLRSGKHVVTTVGYMYPGCTARP